MHVCSYTQTRQAFKITHISHKSPRPTFTWHLGNLVFNGIVKIPNQRKEFAKAKTTKNHGSGLDGRDFHLGCKEALGMPNTEVPQSAQFSEDGFLKIRHT